jgi:putative addiction module killer protein
MRELDVYKTRENKRPFHAWYLSLAREARSRVRQRLEHIAEGSFGDFKPVGEGVLELRIHHGIGLRVYYGVDGNNIVLLLLGGDKSSQGKDIKRAKEYWKDYKERKSLERRPFDQWIHPTE